VILNFDILKFEISTKYASEENNKKWHLNYGKYQLRSTKDD
jgi:hypothetical protein